MYVCLHLLQYGGDVTKILFENERGGGVTIVICLRI